MAFTIIPGSSTTPTVFQGTEEADAAAITSLPNGSTSVIVQGLGSADVINWGITLQNSTISGGQGDDIITPNIIDGATLVGSFVNGNQGNDKIGNPQLGVAATISTVAGGQGNDTLQLGNLQSSLSNGNLGADTINTGIVTGASVNVADSSIFGGQGNDSINVGDGDGGTILNTTNTGYIDSIIDGNLGNDTINVVLDNFKIVPNPNLLTPSTLFQNSTIAGGEGDDYIDASDSINVPLFLTGDAGNDTVIGSETFDLSLFGGAPNGDSINGGEGDDRLEGLTGEDTINGGNGGDIIIGGEDADTLSGGAGVNRFGQGEGSTGDVDAFLASTAPNATNVLSNGDFFTIDGGADVITDWGVAGGANQIATGVLNGQFEQVIIGTAVIDIAANSGGNNFAVRGIYNDAEETFVVSSSGTDLAVFSVSVLDPTVPAGAITPVNFDDFADNVNNFTVLRGQGGAILTSANVTNETIA